MNSRLPIPVRLIHGGTRRTHEMSRLKGWGSLSVVLYGQRTRFRERSFCGQRTVPLCVAGWFHRPSHEGTSQSLLLRIVVDGFPGSQIVDAPDQC
jgi:hypothetical protein